MKYNCRFLKSVSSINKINIECNGICSGCDYIIQYKKLLYEDKINIIDDVVNFREEKHQIKKKGRVNMSRVTNVILKELYPKVEKGLKNTNKWKSLMSDFFQSRSAALYDIAPMDRMYFKKEEEDELFKVLNISKEEVTDILQRTYYYDEFKNKDVIYLVKDEHAMLSLTIIRYFIMKNDKKNIDLSTLYLAFTGQIYASAHYRSFRFAPTDYRRVMEYAINNMSNKYDIVRTGSVIGTIRSLGETWVSSYRSRFKNFNDEDAIYLIQQLKSRVSSFIKNVAKEFYKAFDNKEYITYDSDNVSSDEYHLADSDSLKLERTIDNALNKLETSTTDFRLCKMCSDSNVRTDELKSIIDSIMTNSENFILVKELIRNICTYYFNNGKNKDVTNLEFLSFSISAKPNSKDKLYLRNKDIIEELLLKNSTKYEVRSKRIATKISYNNSILKYFVFLIHEANK